MFRTIQPSNRKFKSLFCECKPLPARLTSHSLCKLVREDPATRYSKAQFIILLLACQLTPLALKPNMFIRFNNEKWNRTFLLVVHMRWKNEETNNVERFAYLKRFFFVLLRIQIPWLLAALSCPIDMHFSFPVIIIEAADFQSSQFTSLSLRAII